MASEGNVDPIEDALENIGKVVDEIGEALNDMKEEADKKAAALTASGKSPYFVQPVKEVIDEA